MKIEDMYINKKEPLFERFMPKRGLGLLNKNVIRLTNRNKLFSTLHQIDFRLGQLANPPYHHRARYKITLSNFTFNCKCCKVVSNLFLVFFWGFGGFGRAFENSEAKFRSQTCVLA